MSCYNCWSAVFFFGAVVAVRISVLLPTAWSYSVDEHYFDAVVDHYNFKPTPNTTFPLRYYVNEEHYDDVNDNDEDPTRPCFFYAGNEADIMQFVKNTGFMFEAAAEFRALVVFAEHRYYGKSLPSADDLSYLTVEQAMADFNTLNLHIRKKWNMTMSTPFIVFGGSYGGNLAMWLRLKNPNLWAGAIASSATPLKHILRETNAFARIETEVYANVSKACPVLVRKGWKELFAGSRTEEGRKHISEELGLCDHISLGGAEAIHGWISGALETMVQYGYPYSTGFYNTVPAFPFKVACRGMLEANSGLGALRAAADVYYNSSGQAGSCYDLDAIVASEAVHWQQKGEHSRLSKQTAIRIAKKQQRKLDSRLNNVWHAWGYQTCTEVYQPMPCNGITDFEVPYQPNKTAYYERCWKVYGVHPRPDWEEMTFMGSSIQAGSNIFLTLGQLDPWRAAGIQEKPKGAPDSIIVRLIEGGAHHLDLRGSNAADPLSVVEVRNEEKAAMRQWIEQWKEIYSS